MGIVSLALTQGQHTLIDEEDLECVLRFRWFAHRRTAGDFDVIGVVNGKPMPLHQYLLPCPPELMPDHIDGDALNNTRANLRRCTKAQNGHNSRVRSTNPSGYKGVFLRPNGRYASAINGRHLGTFGTAEEAARAYDAAAEELYGEFARLNLRDRAPRPVADRIVYQSPVRTTNSSGYQGVTWSKHRRRWVAQLHVKGKHIQLGAYDDPRDAAIAYNQAAREAWGEEAFQNVIEEEGS